MDSNALVSIIVPVYNTQEYLSACVDSLLRQTYTNIQIILVDDQSPDNCPEICDDYAKKDKRILVIHQKNKGVSGARNAGMDAAYGEYIMFVDSDDEIHISAVEHLVNDAKKYNADIVMTKSIRDGRAFAIEIDENSECKVFSDYTPLLKALKAERDTSAVWAKLFKSEFVKDIRFEEGKNINEDGFFMFLCYLRQPILVHHKISIYRYNNREESSSKQRFSDKYLSMLYFADRKKELVLTHCPQYIAEAHNMEVRTRLLFLDILCSAKGKETKQVEKECVKVVRSLYKYHKPVNRHHKQLGFIVLIGLYPVYKVLIKLKHH